MKTPTDIIMERTGMDRISAANLWCECCNAANICEARNELELYKDGIVDQYSKDAYEKIYSDDYLCLRFYDYEGSYLSDNIDESNRVWYAIDRMFSAI